MTKIIAFAGRKQSGKTSAAKLIIDSFPHKQIKVYSFASPLKQLCIDILGLDPQQCYGSDEQKNEEVNCYWEGKQLTAREVMQIVGTEWFRTMQHNVWADATIRQIQKEASEIAIIDDCRFPNEVEAIQNVGGFVMKLNRNIHRSNHASEIALDRENYDELKFNGVVQNQHMDIESKNETIIRILTQKEIL